jgi:hypothetical protein
VTDSPPRGLTFRKLADKRGPEPPRDEAGKLLEPWPLLGVMTVDEPPAYAVIPTDVVNRSVAEGWARLEGEQIVVRAGGPPEDPFRVTHVFRQAAAIVFALVDGDLRYLVEEQPDKDEAGVRWHYLARRAD